MNPYAVEEQQQTTHGALITLAGSMDTAHIPRQTESVYSQVCYTVVHIHVKGLDVMVNFVECTSGGRPRDWRLEAIADLHADPSAGYVNDASP